MTSSFNLLLYIMKLNLRKINNVVLSILVTSYESWQLSVVLELLPLRGEKHFKPLPQNRILEAPNVSFQNFRQVPPTFFY